MEWEGGICAEVVRGAMERNPFERLGSIVYRVLERAILSSELAPGAKLNVAKLAAALDVSATPVREAIEQLCACGLVLAQQREDGKYSNYYVFDISNTDIENLFTARKSVEGMAAYICAQKNWNVELTSLGAMAESFDGALRDYVSSGFASVSGIPVTAGLDMDFHRLIINSTGNQYLIGMYQAIVGKVEYLSIRANQFLLRERTPDKLLLLGSQHLAVYRAIKLGMPQLARQAMEDHMDYCANVCLQNRNLQH